MILSHRNLGFVGCKKAHCMNFMTNFYDATIFITIPLLCIRFSIEHDKEYPTMNHFGIPKNT